MTDFGTSPEPQTAVLGGQPPTQPPAPPGTRGRYPDPGSPRARRLAAIACLILIPALVLIRQCAPAEKPATTAAAAAKAPELDQFSIGGRVMVKLYHAVKDMEGTQNTQTGAQAGTKTSDQIARTAIDELAKAADPSKAMIGPEAVDPREIRLNKLRLAIATGDMLGDEEAIKLFDELAATPPPEPSADLPPKSDPPAPEPSPDAKPAPEQKTAQVIDITEDLAPLRLIYSGRAADLTPQQRKSLEDRHGWWGRLALTNDLPDTDPARAPLISGGFRIVVAFMFGGIVLLVAAVGCVGAIVTLIVMAGQGSLRRRFVPPAPGGSVYLEMVPVFVLCFMLFMFGVDLVSHYFNIPHEIAIGAQWLLVIVPFWPLLRGVRFADHRRMMGWHTGRGVLREIGAGVVAYLASLPLLLAAMGVTVALMAIKMLILKSLGRHAEPPQNPVLDIFTKVDGWTLAIIVSLAVVWAPIVEEAVFRGSFYRHLRARGGVLASALLSTLVFGVMHGYELLMLGPVLTLGFVFALMREWRGSLIAPMTAHALNNGTIVTLLVLVLSAVKD